MHSKVRFSFFLNHLKRAFKFKVLLKKSTLIYSSCKKPINHIKKFTKENWNNILHDYNFLQYKYEVVKEILFIDISSLVTHQMLIESFYFRNYCDSIILRFILAILRSSTTYNFFLFYQLPDLYDILWPSFLS